MAWEMLLGNVANFRNNSYPPYFAQTRKNALRRDGRQYYFVECVSGAYA